jgi:hypothetical protein
MNRKSTLFYFYDLRVTLNSMALIAFGGLAAVMFVIWLLLGFSFFEALAGGLIAALLHELLTFAHHFGHAIAARRVGHPMEGIHFWGVLAISVYPRNEPALPGRIHIQRALGGPILSGLITVLLGIVLVLLRPHEGLLDALIVFATLDSLLTYTLGPLIPLQNIAGIETDMDTLLKWMRQG